MIYSRDRICGFSFLQEHEMGGIFNIIVGLIMVVAGLSGKFALFGTKSSGLLAVVGAIVAGYGIYRTVKGRS